MHSQIREDRRLFSRINFGADACISQGNGKIPCHLVDISLNGVLIEAHSDLQIDPGQPCTLLICLSDEATITMHLQLIHTSRKLLGFQCSTIDMESIGHLRRLIELNIPGAEASQRVLAELLNRQPL